MLGGTEPNSHLVMIESLKVCGAAPGGRGQTPSARHTREPPAGTVVAMRTI
jgi:hypothetical protein